MAKSEVTDSQRAAIAGLIEGKLRRYLCSKAVQLDQLPAEIAKEYLQETLVDSGGIRMGVAEAVTQGFDTMLSFYLIPGGAADDAHTEKVNGIVQEAVKLTEQVFDLIAKVWLVDTSEELRSLYSEAQSLVDFGLR